MPANTAKEATNWDYQEGLLELLESGAGQQDIEQKLQAGALQVPGRTRAGLTGTKIDQLIKWLQGFRRDKTIYENEKVYLPVIDLWAPPGGKAELKYTVAKEDSLSSEIGLFGFAGFGGSSKRKITDSFGMNAGPAGTNFSIGVLLTVTHYIHKDGSAKSFDRIDIKGIEDGFDHKQTTISPADFFLPDQTIKESDLTPDNYSKVSYLRLTNLTTEGSSTHSHEAEESCEWSFDLSLPLLQDKVKLGAKTNRSRGFEVSFECPNGHDYAFFSRFGENRAVPYCARVIN